MHPNSVVAPEIKIRGVRRDRDEHLGLSCGVFYVTTVQIIVGIFFSSKIEKELRVIFNQLLLHPEKHEGTCSDWFEWKAREAHRDRRLREGFTQR